MPETTVEKRPKYFRSLRTKLLFAFLVPSLSVLLIASALQLFFDFRTQKELVVTQQILALNNAARAVQNFVEMKFHSIATAASLDRLVRGDENDQKLILQKLLGLEPSFRRLAIFDRSGQMHASASRLSSFTKSRLDDPQNIELFTETKENGTYVSPVYIDDTSSEPMILIGVLVEDVLGARDRIILAEVNLKFLWDLVAGIKVGDAGLAYVVDRSGNLVAFGDTSRVLRGENLNHLNEVEEFQEGDTDDDMAKMTTGINGTSVVSSFVALGSPDWAVVVESPTSEGYKTVRDALLRSLLIIFASTLMIVAASLYFSRTIVTPIKSLRDATENIRAGNFNTHVSVDSSDEIGEVAATFNSMIEQIGASYSELEHRVEERTKELSKKVAEAEALNKFMVGRELKMIALKEEIARLKGESPGTEKPK